MGKHATSAQHMAGDKLPTSDTRHGALARMLQPSCSPGRLQAPRTHGSKTREDQAGPSPTRQV
eukprot:6062468-Pleurochrysis_carterae.AAC.2